MVHPYDWTYTTDYKGETMNVTCSIIFESFIFEIYLEVFPPGSLSPHWEVESAPDLSIDYEKLKIQEKILFFDEVY